MTECVIFDIDGTLADVTHRLHFVTNGKRDWDGFFAALGDDLCVDPIARLLSICGDNMPVLLCSGRPETCRTQTEAWLLRYMIEYHTLYMRGTEDRRPDHTVKREILGQMRRDGWEPVLVVDDRQSVVDMWRDEGLTCLQCRAPELEGRFVGAQLTLMVGPSGGGKSTWLSVNGIDPGCIISSDAIRQQMCGDFRDQTRNDDVFAAVHGLVSERLKHGLWTVLDATNLRRKDRLAAAALARGGSVRYVVVNRPMDQKYRDAGWRGELGFDLIAKHEQTFKSQVADILRGDDQSNVEVVDVRA